MANASVEQTAQLPSSSATRSLGGAEAVLEALASIQRVATERENTFVAEVAADAARRLAEKRFNLVVLGEFKRGKTTFINSLIGAELLPSAVVPLTSVITVVSYGDKPSARIEFLDGSVRDVAIEDLQEFVTERGNPGNVRGVRLAAVSYPSAYLRDGLSIVDTPGVGSVHQHNTDTAYSFLPKADAGVFLLTSDPPISAQERAYLRDVLRHVPRLFFLLNKVDRLSQEELNEALQFTRQVLTEELGSVDVQLYAVSARRALQARLNGDHTALETSGLPRFERELARFLREERAEVAITAARRRALALAEELQSGLGLERRALSLSLEKLRSAAAAFEAQMQEIQEQRKEDMLLVDWATRHILKEVVDPSLRDEQTMGRDRLVKELAAFAKERRSLPNGAFMAALNEWLPNALTDAALDWRARQEDAVRDALNKALSRFSERARRHRDSVADAVRGLFEISLPQIPVEVPLPDSLAFSLHTWAMVVRVDPLLAPLLQLLPTPYFHGLMVSRAYAKIRDRWPMALGHAREDLSKRIAQTAAEYQAALGASLDALIDGLRGALAHALTRHEEGQEFVARDLARLEQQSQELARCVELLSPPPLRPQANGNGAHAAATPQQ